MTVRNVIFTTLAAGAFATIAFDAFGQGLSPMLGFSRLAPAPLATQTLATVFGAVPAGAGELLHLLTGLVFYAIGWVAIARPIQLRVLPTMPWIVTAVIYGIVLWVFALYVMAHLVAGNPAFLGFTGITWVALWGHIIYAVVVAATLEMRGVVLNPRRAESPAFG